MMIKQYKTFAFCNEKKKKGNLSFDISKLCVLTWVHREKC